MIELTNNFLVTYDRGFQISVFKPLLNQNLIQYQLIYNKINKDEHVYSLLALPNIVYNENWCKTKFSNFSKFKIRLNVIIDILNYL